MPCVPRPLVMLVSKKEENQGQSCCKQQGSSGLCSLRRHRRQLRAEDAVPEPAGDTESIFVVGKVVLEVIFLKLAVV